MKYLITSSLLDGYDWLKSCPKNWQQKAQDDFIAMIKRESRPVTDACQRGIDFENLVCENCNKMDDQSFKDFAFDYYDKKGIKGFERDMAAYTTLNVAKIVRNGEQQVPVKKDVFFNGDEYHLFGYADIILPNKIIDIKTTGKYQGGYHYVKRSQHYLYSLCTGINTFEYVIADYKESKIPRELHRVEFEMRQDENFDVLEKRIANLIEFIKNCGLFSDYCNIFTAQHDDNRKKGEGR